jgi:hypothetical protein
VSVLAGAAGLLGSDAAAAATAVGPVAEVTLTRLVSVTRQRLFRHAGETVADAAQASDSSVGDLLGNAVSVDRRHELLSRVLSIAQDTALRDKRRALGSALAAGIEGDDARIDDELLFVRAIADVDEPHIKPPRILFQGSTHRGSLGGTVSPVGWSLAVVAERHPVRVLGAGAGRRFVEGAEPGRAGDLEAVPHRGQSLREPRGRRVVQVRPPVERR